MATRIRLQVYFIIMPSERDYLSDDQLKSSNGEIEVCGLFIYNFIHVL